MERSSERSYRPETLGVPGPDEPAVAVLVVAADPIGLADAR